MTILVVYVPSRQSHLRKTIKAGSAIVGASNSDEYPVPKDRIVVDFEGNLYGAVNLRTFEQRALHAAGRHLLHYPTTARLAVNPEELIEVGLYDSELESVIVTNQTELEAWNTP